MIDAYSANNLHHTYAFVVDKPNESGKVPIVSTESSPVAQTKITPTKMNTETIRKTAKGTSYTAMIQGIPQGDYSWARKIGDSEIYVARADRAGVMDHLKANGLAAESTGYLVRIVWQVNESYRDDAESFMQGYQPFGAGRAFVGLDVFCATAEQAATVASDFHTQIEKQAQPNLYAAYADHAAIGNVARR